MFNKQNVQINLYLRILNYRVNPHCNLHELEDTLGFKNIGIL